jgi:2-keto-4-pentenoate hydratase/2-oxohepta-3-ene-1,7-dioic acid hydratase in catechol pathway
MRIVSISTDDGPRAALERDGRAYPYDRSVDELIADGLSASDPGGEGMLITEAELLPPLGSPGKLICIGQNYHAHAREQGAEAPKLPTFFAKWPNALAAPGASVPLPAWSRVDYEAEVAFVIGRRAKEVPENRALEHVAAYSLLNDLSARDYQFKTPQWMPGKVFDGSAPFGPALVTPDEAGPHDAIEFSLTLNGETMQEGSTADLVHSVPALVAYLSMLMTLEPGDVISTGTPAGVGSLRDPRVWLAAGDEVIISSPTLGVLETRLA